MEADLSWTCHVCGRLRPDARISVRTTVLEDPILGRVQENVRYCNDRPECADAAASVHFTELRPGKEIGYGE